MDATLKQLLAQYEATPDLTSNLSVLSVHEFKNQLRNPAAAPDEHDVWVTPPVRPRTAITFAGSTKTVQDWAMGIGITTSALVMRLKRNSIRDSLTLPPHTKKS